MTTNLFLFQLADSNFPIGSFSHSYGLETYLHHQKIDSAAGFKNWLMQFMENQVLSSDGLAIRFCYEALLESDVKRVIHVNEELNAFLLPLEIRQGNQKMGRQFLNIGLELSPDAMLLEYQQGLRESGIAPHPAIVFTVLLYLQAQIPEILTVYLLNILTSLVQNAVRGVPIGQVAGQKIIRELSHHIPDWQSAILKMHPRQFGATAPGIEIAQMQHEFLFARNFMS